MFEMVAIKAFFSSLSLKTILYAIASLAIAGLVGLGFFYKHENTKLQNEIKQLKLNSQVLEATNKDMKNEILKLRQSSNVNTDICKEVHDRNQKTEENTDKVIRKVEDKVNTIRIKHSKPIINPTTHETTIVEESSDVTSVKDQEISKVRIIGLWQVYCGNIENPPDDCKINTQDDS